MIVVWLDLSARLRGFEQKPRHDRVQELMQLGDEDQIEAVDFEVGARVGEVNHLTGRCRDRLKRDTIGTR